MPADDEQRRLSSRPEAPWALWAGIAGGVVATVLTLRGMAGADAGTAAIGFVIVPLVAIAAMVPAAIWGLAVGCLWLSWRGAQRYVPGMLVAAWAYAVAVPAVIAWEIWRGAGGGG